MARLQHVDTGDRVSQDVSSTHDKKKEKSRRPPNTAFRQQRLKAWQPILTPKTVLPLFFIVGIIFAPIGGLLLYASALVREISIDYTNCNTTAPIINDIPSDPKQIVNLTGLSDIPSDKVSATFKDSMKSKPQWARGRANFTPKWTNNEQEVDVCIVTFNIPDNIKAPILFYYRLTNFYQNHRRYVKSVDIDQLKGKARSANDINSGDCTPLALAPAPDSRPYYPCGLIANSMFNDAYSSLMLENTIQQDGKTIESYDMSTAQTSWAHEGDLYGKTAYNPQDVVPPPQWQKYFKDGKYDSLAELPNLHEWEEFQVWMRTAGLPTFSKLYQRNDKDELKAGTYRVMIYDLFPVTQYSGTKSILISTSTVMGGKNPFLGIAYLVVGGLCILLGAVFLATHLIKPRKLGDHTYLTWNNDQPSTATTTGRAGGA